MNRLCRDRTPCRRLLPAIAFAGCVVLMSGGVPAWDRDLWPTCENTKAKLSELLSQAGPEDHVFMLFTGHADLADGKLYLCPIDYDSTKPSDKGIAVEWLRREMDRCKAKLKLLVIDTCHAGSDKAGGGPFGVTAKDLAEPFRSVPGVITLGSSTAEEKSYVWETKEQSIYSYWLNQGLKGHADRDGNGEVDVLELHKYVSENVPFVADKLRSAAQHPVMFMARPVAGVPVVIRPEPHTLEGLLDDMAEQLATIVELREIPAVGVTEFSLHAKGQELKLGGDLGWLGAYCVFVAVSLVFSVPTGARCGRAVSRKPCKQCIGIKVGA